MPVFAKCTRCGGDIWPETPTFPLCQYCAVKVSEEAQVAQEEPKTEEPAQTASEAREAKEAVEAKEPASAPETGGVTGPARRRPAARGKRGS